MQDTLARKLRVIRAQRGLTLRQAAAELDVTPGTLSELERGLRHPHDVTLAKIAKGYGVPVEELLEEPVPLGEAPTPGPTNKTGDRRRRARLAPRIARLESLDLGPAELRDRQQAIEDRLPELKRMVPFGHGVKEEITDEAEYYDLVDELFAIKTVLEWNNAKQPLAG